MANIQAHIFEQLFGKSLQDESAIPMLQQVIKDHPYFTPAHFFLLQKMDKQDKNYQTQAAITALIFNNPHWLHFQLSQKNSSADNFEPGNYEINNNQAIITEKEDSSQDILTEIFPENSSNPEPESIIQPSTDIVINQENEKIPVSSEPKLNITTPDNDELIFEPLFATDYFASQGIKLSENIQPTDKLGKQLKSFTDWLKTMKKIHTEKLPAGSEATDITIQKLAEKSNTDEEVLTEAMAEVFAKQNKLNKAIEVYQKLSLLNPSKSAYFAAKIEHLK
ncbi:MAG: hypothetical protein IPJ81_04410 [Chitinophagaceae bacterium]|nr:hypothetical protein [Chitinophagaceae bacterium]